MSIPRMNYPQYRKARKLTHECCNYCDGNCLLLDDGEECVCVQSISYSLLCRWFRAAVLPLDGALYAEIIQSRDNLTRRQLICFGGAAAVGIPVYLLTRHALGGTGAMFLMIAIMLPAFFMAMYERDGLPFEKVARNIIRAKFLRPGVRPYQTQNIYAPFAGKEVTLEQKPQEVKKPDAGR